MINESASEVLLCCNKRYHSNCLFKLNIHNGFKCPNCCKPTTTKFLEKEIRKLRGRYSPRDVDCVFHSFNLCSMVDVKKLVPPPSEY